MERRGGWEMRVNLTSRRSRLVYGVRLRGGGTMRLLRRRDLLLRSWMVGGLVSQYSSKSKSLSNRCFNLQRRHARLFHPIPAPPSLPSKQTEEETWEGKLLTKTPS